MTATPVGAVTYDLMGGTVTRPNFIDPTTMTESDFIENGVFNLASAADFTFNGVLRDGGGVLTFRKLGSGNVTLTGANTNSGETSIVSGTLTTGADNTLSFNSRLRVGAVLELAGYDQTVRGFYQSGIIRNTSGGTATLTTNPGVTNSFAGSIVETAGNEISLAKTGAGRQDLLADNTYSGGTTLAGGTLGFGTSLSLGTGTVEVIGAGSILRALGTNVTLANDIVLSADGTIEPGSSTVLAGVISGTGSLTKTGGGTLTIANTGNTYSGGTFLQGGTLRLGGDNVLGDVAQAVVVGPASAIGTSGVSALLSNNIVANAQTTFVAPDAQVLDIAGVVSGTGNLVVQGASGTVILRSANTYTGTTQLQGGTLGVGNNLSLGGADTALLVAGPATLKAYNNVSIENLVRLTADLTVDTNGFDMVLTDNVNNATAMTSGGLIKAGAGTLTLTLANNYSGGTTLRGGTLSVGANNRLGNATGGVTFDGGALRVTGAAFTTTSRAFTLLGTGAIDIADAANVFTVAAPITGAGGITKSGPGTLVLAATNTFSGGVVLDTGTLVIENNDSLGAASSTLTTAMGTTVQFGSTPRTLTLANPIIVNGSTTFATNGNSILDNFMTGVVSTDGSVVTLNGAVSGAGPIVLSPYSDLTLAAANSFGGTFTVDRSIVRVGNAAAFGNSSVVLDNAALRNDSGSALVIANALSLTGTSTVGGTNDLTLGSIGGTGNLIKIGADTLTLTGNSTFTGSATVNGGTLNLQGNLVGGGGTTINAGGTLTGSGTIVGTTSSNGGTLAPASTLIFDNLFLDDATNLNFGLQTPGVVGSPNDLIVVNNNLLLDGTINIAALPGFTTGTYRLINYGGALNDFGLLIGSVPIGFNATNFTIDTSTANQVNLILSIGSTVYWDGADMAGDGTVDGGSGTWNTANMNWTTETGAVNGAWGSGTGIFQTVGGTVSVADALDFDMLSFRVTDYLLTDGGGTLRPSAIGEIETQDGVTTTINAAISGANGINKTGNGTLVLGGANSFLGGVNVVAGTLQVTSTGALGAGQFTVNAGTTVVLDSGFANDILINGAGGTGGTFVTGTGNASLTGLISGTGSLTKTGAFDLRLSNANSYSGGTFVNAGVLRADDNTAFGTGAVAIADGAGIFTGIDGLIIANDIALTGNAGINPSNNLLTLSGTVSGTGTLVKQGSGTLVLTGANSYQGGTSIRSGTLSVANDGNLGAAGGAIDFTGVATKILQLTGNFTSGRNIALNNNAEIDTGAFDATLNGVISGPATLSKSGSGVMTLTGVNTYEGGTNAAAGTLSIGSDANLGQASGVLRLGVDGVSSATLRLTGAVTSTRGVIVEEDSAIDTGANSGSFAGNFNGTGRLTKVGSGELALSGNNNGFSGGILLTAGTLTLGSNTASGTGGIETTGSTINYLDGIDNGGTINVNSNSTNLQVLGSAVATQSGVISETGVRPLAKIGTGTLILSAANTNSGLFSVNEGVIGVANNQALGLGNVALANATGLLAAASVSLANAVTVTGATTINTQGFTLGLTNTVSGTGSIAKTGAGTLNLSGNNSYAGGTQLNAGTIRIFTNTALGGGQLAMADATTLVAGAEGLNIANAIALNGAATIDTGAFLFATPGLISGNGRLIKTGSGVLFLENSNTYSGGTDINNGTVVVYNGASAGTGTIAMSDGTQLVTAGGTFTTPNAITIAGTGSILTQGAGDNWTLSGLIADGVTPGTLAKNGPGTINLTNANSYSGGTNLNGGTIRVTNNLSLGTGTLTAAGGTTLISGAPAITLANTGVLNGALTINLTGTTAVIDQMTGSYTSNGSALMLTGPISGAGSITTANFGTLTLAGNNSFAGGVIATTAQVLVTNANSLGTGTLTLADQAGLRNNSGGAVTLANNIALGGASNSIGGSSDLTLGGVISGASGFTKVGTDTLTLTGTSTYTGSTTVNGGTLKVNGALTGGGDTIVNGGATLAGTGSIAGNVSLANGAILSPGNSPGTLAIGGNLTLSAFTLVNYELGQANVIGGAFNDRTTVGGILTLDGLLTVTDSNAFGLGVYNLFTYGGALVDNGLSIASLPGAFTGLVQTLVPGQVNLIITAPGTLVQYWDGADFAGNGAINGGTGTWNALNTNWTTDAPSALNTNWQGGVAVFAGAAGTVTLATAQTAQGLQFTTDGYLLQGAALNFNVPAFVSTSGGVTATIASQVTGAGSLAKQGAGTLVLNGENSYAGGTTITGGTVVVGSNTALSTGAVTIGDATLAAGADGLSVANAITTTGNAQVDAGPGTFTLAGNIGGAGSITAIGAGNLVLNGNNSFAGLTIDNGTVTVGTNTAAGAAGIAMADGTTLAAGANGLALANAITTAGVASVNQGPGVFTLNGDISGAGSISAVGAGNLVLNGNNSYVGLNIVAGTVTVGTSTAGGVGGITINGGTTLAAGADGLVLANAITTTGSGRVNQGPGTFTLNGNIGGAGSISAIGAGNLVLNGNNSFVNLGINAGTVTVGTNTAAGIGEIAINDGTILAAGVTGLALANDIVTTGSGRVNQGPGVFTLDGDIGGAGSISAIGTGNLVLNGNNSFTNLGINQGTVTVGTNTAAGIGGIALNDGTILAAGADGLALANDIVTTGSGRVNQGPGTFTLNGDIGGAGSISAIGTGNLVLNGNNSFVNLGINQGTVTVGTNTAAGIGGIALNDGTILAAGVSGLTLANDIVTTGSGRVNQGPGTFTLNGDIGGAGSISAIGTGNLVLNGNNSFVNLGINRGTVTVGTNTAAGIGGIALNDGTILAAGADNLALANDIVTTGDGRVNQGPGTFTLNGDIGGAGSISAIGMGNLVLNGNNSFTNLGINQGTVTVGTNTAAGIGGIALNDGTILAAGVSGLTVANYIVTTGSGRIDSGSGVFTLSGSIGGAGSISQIGTGNLVLNGNNSFVNLGINQGTVTVGTNTAAGVGGIAINDGAILAAGVSGLVLANDIVTTGGGRVDQGAGVFTLDGDIAGAGSISAIGTGNLVLNGNNSFVNLGINQGTVTVGSDTAAGSGGIALNDGAILAAGVSGLTLANDIVTTGGGRVNSGPGIFTLDGDIAGAGSISAIGTGNLVLNGNNSFVNLGINQGTVTVGTNTAAGSGGIAINGGAILAAGVSGITLANDIVTTGGGRVDQGSGVFTLDGDIAGAGSISSIGTGNLVLNGNNSFVNLGINQGTVTVGTNTAAGSGGIAINDGAILAAGVSGLTLTNNIVTTGGGRVDQGAGVFTLAGNIAGAGSISAIGTGNLVLNGNNSFVNLGINQGTVTVGSNTAAGSGGIAINDGAIFAAGISGLTISNGIVTTGGGRVDQGSGVFTLAGNIAGAGSISSIGTGNLVLNGNNSFVNLGINQGTVTVGTNTAAGSGGIAINDGAILAAGVSGLTLTNDIVTTGGGRVDQGSGVFTLAGNIAGAGSISSIGTGNLVLNGNNSFVNLGVNQGRVTLGTNTAAGSGGIAINDGAILAAGVSGLTIANNIVTTGGGRIDSGAGVFTLTGAIAGAGSISQIGTGNLVLNGANSFVNLGINQGRVTVGTNTAAGVGSIAINDGGILAAGVSGLTLSNFIITTGGGRIDSGAGTFTLTGAIAGAGSISQIGTGNLVLNGANSFVNLGINQGRVTVGTNTAAGVGSIAINEGGILAAGVSGLTLSNFIVTTGGGRIDSGTGTFTLTGAIAGAGSISQIGTGNLVLNGANSFTNLGINQGTVTLGTNTAAGIGAIAINNGGILAAGVSGLTIANQIVTTGGGRVDSGAGVFTLSGTITGAGSISQIGTGNLVLNGANSFVNLGINQGAVTVGTNTAAGSGAIAINNGATLAAGVTGVTLANAIQTTAAGRVDSGTGIFALSGVISGTGSITKVGSGTLILTGNSTYTGATSAAAGRLLVLGSIGPSAVTVQSGATLGGNGTVGATSVLSGGTLAPGVTANTAGTVNVNGNLTLAAGSTYSIDIAGTTSDRVAVTGTANIAGSNLVVSPTNAPMLFNTSYTILTSTGARSGTFASTSLGQFGQAFVPTVIYGTNDVMIRLAPGSIAGAQGAGGTANTNAIAGALDAAVTGGFNPQNFFGLYLLNGAALTASLNQFTGEIGTANSRTALADTRYVREAAFDRLGATLKDGDAATTTTNGDHSTTLWARGIGSWTDTDGDGNGAALDIEAKGVIAGIDYSFGDVKVGAMFNYIHSDVDTQALGKGNIESTGGGAYIGYRPAGGFAVGAGAAISSVKGETSRGIGTARITQSLSSDTDGTVYQVFGEVAYDLAATDAVRIEPFARLAYVKYDLDGYSEAGGFAALTQLDAKYDITVASAGVRGSTAIGGSATLRGSLGYQNISGDRDPIARSAFQGTSSYAAIRGVALDKSSFVGEAGVDFRIGDKASLGVGYSGIIGKNNSDNGVKATFTLGF
ncbi:autotransporter-associated beta strand repeat-containing protein [Glacieibacterium frigidum]|nr:autotransporter-associated beta strand repeat-containing protein [Glacieibacterium frigidum]